MMPRRAEYRNLVSGLEPHIESFNSQWNKAFPSADGGNYLFRLGGKDKVIYFLDCLPSSQPFRVYQPLPIIRNPVSFTSAPSLLPHYLSTEQDSRYQNGQLSLHCILGGLILQPVGKAQYRTPFLVTKGFGDLQKDWCLWFWWKHDIKTPPQNRKGLLSKQHISCVKLGDIGPNKGLPVDIQYAQGFICGRPHLVHPFSLLSVQLEDMEKSPAETPKAFGIDVILYKLQKIDEYASYADLEEVKDWFTSGHAADLKDVKVELNSATTFLDIGWENDRTSFVSPIDHYSGRGWHKKPHGFIPKVSKRPPPNTAFTLHSKGQSLLVVSLGQGFAGDKGVNIKSDLGYVLWAPELKTFLIIFDYINKSGEGELSLPGEERVGTIELSEKSKGNKVEIKYSVLKLDFSTTNTDQATLEVLTNEGYELTVADMEGGKMGKVAITR